MIPGYLPAFLRAGTVPGSNFAARGSPHGTAAPERLSELLWEGDVEPAQGGSAEPKITPQRMGHVVPNASPGRAPNQCNVPDKTWHSKRAAEWSYPKNPCSICPPIHPGQNLCQDMPVLAESHQEIIPGMSWKPQSSSQHCLQSRETWVHVQFPPSTISQTSRGKAHGAKSLEQNHPRVGSATKRPKCLDRPLQSKKTSLSNPQLHGLVTAALPVPCCSIQLGSTGLCWRIPASSRSGTQLGSLVVFNFAQTLL